MDKVPPIPPPKSVANSPTIGKQREELAKGRKRKYNMLQTRGTKEVHARSISRNSTPVDPIKNRAELCRCPSSARLFASPAGQRRSGTPAGTLRVAPLTRPTAATNRARWRRRGRRPEPRIGDSPLNFIAQFDVDEPGETTDLSLQAANYDSSLDADYDSWFILEPLEEVIPAPTPAS